MFFRVDNNLILEHGYNQLFRCIFASGGVVPIGTINITLNGIYDVATYANANVNVPQPTGTISITANGTVNVNDYQYANVNVPQGIFPSGTKTITQNGTFDVTNYTTADVALPLGTKTITDNGTYLASDDSLQGFSSVNVALPLGTKTITANGTYNAVADLLKGFSSVMVNVSGVTQGTFTLDSRKYLYHDITDTPDSVYEITHGLDHTPTFFFIWEDGTGGLSGVTQYTYGFLLPNEMRSYIANYSSGMGSPSSSSSQNMTFRPFGDNSIVANSTKVILRGSSSSTTYFLAGNSIYRWIAF